MGCPYHSPLLGERLLGDLPPQDLPPERFERLCCELRLLGTHTLILQGTGEPLLHPHLGEMITVAKSLGFTVEMISNGTLLTRERVEPLLDAGLDRLKVSLWASSPEQYPIMYPGTDPEYFNRVVAGLKGVAALKAERQAAQPSVAVYQPLARANYQTIERMIDFVREVGANGLLFGPLSMEVGQNSSVALDPDEEQEARSTLARAREQLDALGLRHNIDQVLVRYEKGHDVWQRLPCYMAWLHLRFRVDGKVQPCGRCPASLSFGNVNEQSVREIWNSSPIRAFRRQAMTRAGLAALAAECDCTFCCYVVDNLRIHRVFRRLAPLVRRPAG
jgi:radical SAM protein with 4Fe4S-binding SPASM domain